MNWKKHKIPLIIGIIIIVVVLIFAWSYFSNPAKNLCESYGQTARIFRCTDDNSKVYLKVDKDYIEYYYDEKGIFVLECDWDENMDEKCFDLYGSDCGNNLCKNTSDPNWCEKDEDCKNRESCYIPNNRCSPMFTFPTKNETDYPNK